MTNLTNKFCKNLGYSQIITQKTLKITLLR